MVLVTGGAAVASVACQPSDDALQIIKRAVKLLQSTNTIMATNINQEPESGQQQSPSSPMEMSGALTTQNMESNNAKPTKAKRKRASFEDNPQVEVKTHHSPGSVLKRLPLSSSSYLQHKPKGEILYNKNDRTADLVLSKQNHDEVNFYATHPEKAQGSFVGLIEPTDEVLAALARTIKGEVGVTDGKTRVVFSFSVVDPESPANIGSRMTASTPNTTDHGTGVNPGSSKHGVYSFPYPPSGNTKVWTGSSGSLSSSHVTDSSPLNNLARLRNPPWFRVDGNALQSRPDRGLALQRSSP